MRKRPAGARPWTTCGPAERRPQLCSTSPCLTCPGYEFHEELKRDPALAKIPVVVFSALDDDGRLRGVVAYVRKAVDSDVLLRALERACGATP